jgi:hypothetical protein
MRYDFSNGQTDNLKKIRIYSRETDAWKVQYPDADGAIESVLRKSGLWQDSHGKPRFVSIEPIVAPDE